MLKCAYKTTLLYHRHQFFVNTNFNFANVQIYFKLSYLFLTIIFCNSNPNGSKG